MRNGRKYRERRNISNEFIEPSSSFLQLTEEAPEEGRKLLKLGRKGSAYETILSISKDKNFLEWTGKWITRKSFVDRRVFFNTINRIQSGQYTFPFERLKYRFGKQDHLSFSVIYENIRSLDLIAPNEELYDIWYNGLKSCLEDHMENQKLEKENSDVISRFLQHKFNLYDPFNTGFIKRKHVYKTIARMNTSIGKYHIKTALEDMNLQQVEQVSFADFKLVVSRIHRRPEFEFLWDHLVENRPVSEVETIFEFMDRPSDYRFRNHDNSVDISRFLHFWEELQGEHLSEEDCRAMFWFASDDNRGDGPEAGDTDSTKVQTSGRETIEEIGEYGTNGSSFMASGDGYDNDRNNSNNNIQISSHNRSNSHNSNSSAIQSTSSLSVAKISLRNRTLSPLSNNDSLRYSDWLRMISHESNQAYDPIKLKAPSSASMDHPLSHYYISSSHRTYLESTSLISGSASINRYIDDLCRNCRFIEVEVWDDREGRMPIVGSAQYKTNELSLRDVMAAIAVYAFQYTPYPLIIFLDNNCSQQVQAKVAEMIKQELGDLLLYPEEFSLEPDAALPSPLQLQNKIIILGEKTTTLGTKPQVDNTVEDLFLGNITKSASKGQICDIVDHDPQEVMRINFRNSGLDSGRNSPRYKKEIHELSPNKPSPPPRDRDADYGEYADIETYELEEGNHLPDNNIVHQNEQIHPTLSALIYLRASYHRYFTDLLYSNTPCDYISHITEEEAMRYYKSKHVTDWQLYNIRHLSRIFPQSSRVDGSNMDPVTAWACGNQIVVMNFQNCDDFVHMNNGMFRQNDCCGYVLKSEYMLSRGSRPSRPVTVQVHLISAQFLPHNPACNSKDVIDPFITTGIKGLGKDTKSYTSKTIISNGFNPIFDEVMEFRIRQPDVAHIMFRVFDESGISALSMFVACASIPISCLRPGLRCVLLFDEQGNRLGDYAQASLIVRTKIL